MAIAAPSRHFLMSFLALSVTAGTSVGVAKVATSLYAVRLGTSPGELGLLAGAQSAGLIFTSLPIGALVDRVGARRLFVLGSLCAGLLYLLVPLVPSTSFLLACTLAIGFFMPFRFLSLQAEFMRHLELVGTGRAGWHRAVNMVGVFLLGPTIAGLLVASAGFRNTFLLIGASFILTVFLAARVLGGPASRGPAPQLGQVVRGMRGLLGDRPLLETTSLDFFGQAALMYFNFFIVHVAINRFGLPPTEAAALVAVNGASFVLALLALGPALLALGKRRFYLGALTVVCTGLVLLGAAGGLRGLWLGAVVLGLGLGSVQVVNLDRLVRIGGRLGRGRVVGVAALAGPCGGLFGAVAGGALSRAMGIQGVFLAMVPIFTLYACRYYLRREPWCRPANAN